jgi:hypothetical protein
LDVSGGPYNPSPVLAAGEVGTGRAVFIGDATPLDGKMWDGLGDGNRKLLGNIVAWLKKPESDPSDPPDPPAPSGPISVTIKIRPWCKVNKIDLNSKGFVRVAVLTGSGFDAKQIKSSTVRFAEAKPLCWHLMDVDRDRDKDLLFLFHIPDLKLSDDSTEAILKLTGQTKSDQSFEGTELVQVIPKKKCKKPPQKGHDCGGRGK